MTFAALKPGLVFEPGASRAGEVVVVDIGLDVSGAGRGSGRGRGCPLVVARRPATSPQVASAVRVVAGSAGMDGAASLAAAGAQRAAPDMSASRVPVGWPAARRVPIEVVQVALPQLGWSAKVRDDLDRFGALVIGNGVGTDAACRPRCGPW